MLMLAMVASAMLRIVSPLMLLPALSAYRMMLVAYVIVFASSLVYGCFIGFPFLLVLGFVLLRTRCWLRSRIRLVLVVFCFERLVVFSFLLCLGG